MALLLPMQGQLANVARALRDGFMSAYYHAQQGGQNPPQISLYDSTEIAALDSFYTQARTEGLQLERGPLAQNLAKALRRMPQRRNMTRAPTSHERDVMG